MLIPALHETVQDISINDSKGFIYVICLTKHAFQTKYYEELYNAIPEPKQQIW